VNRATEQWLQERSEAPLDRMKGWLWEMGTPLLDAVQGHIGVAKAGKQFLDEGGEAAELGVLAKKMACDAVDLDKDIVTKMQCVIALYKEAAHLLHGQSGGLSTLGRLAEVYSQKAQVCGEALEILREIPEMPPMSDVEWGATQFLKLRQAQVQLGLREQVGGEIGRRSVDNVNIFYCCVDDQSDKISRSFEGRPDQQAHQPPTVHDLQRVSNVYDQAPKNQEALYEGSHESQDPSEIERSRALWSPLAEQFKQYAMIENRGCSTATFGSGCSRSVQGNFASGTVENAQPSPVVSASWMGVPSDTHLLSVPEQAKEARLQQQHDDAVAPAQQCTTAVSSSWIGLPENACGSETPRHEDDSVQRAPSTFSTKSSSSKENGGEFFTKDQARQAASRRALQKSRSAITEPPQSSTAPSKPPSGVRGAFRPPTAQQSPFASLEVSSTTPNKPPTGDQGIFRPPTARESSFAGPHAGSTHGQPKHERVGSKEMRHERVGSTGMRPLMTIGGEGGADPHFISVGSKGSK
jgi:hypothetical protein